MMILVSSKQNSQINLRLTCQMLQVKMSTKEEKAVDHLLESLEVSQAPDSFQQLEKQQVHLVKMVHSPSSPG